MCRFIVDDWRDCPRHLDLIQASGLNAHRRSPFYGRLRAPRGLQRIHCGLMATSNLQNMMCVMALCRRGPSFPRRGPPLIATLTTVALATALTSCSQRPAGAEAPPVSNEPGATTLKAQLQPLLGTATSTPEQEEPDLRRGYGIVDMRFNRA